MIKDASNQVIMTSRIRLARNVCDSPFPNIMSYEVSEEFVNSVMGVFQKMKGYEIVDINKNSLIDNNLLIEKRLISPEFLKSDLRKIALINKDKTASVMVNEEDHIRIQAILRGRRIQEAYELAGSVDDLFDEHFNIGFSEHYGYLTSCPTNVGTGLRVSYMIHVPLLELTNQIENIKNAITKLGLTVRGIYGEGTESEGGLYQISNQVTLGQRESEIIKSVDDVIDQIIEKEVFLREKLKVEEHIKIKDEVCRAYGTLSNAQMMSVKEAMLLLSYLKIGIDLELIEKEKLDHIDVYDLMIKIQKNNILKQRGKKLKAMDIEIERAKLLREELNN